MKILTLSNKIEIASESGVVGSMHSMLKMNRWKLFLETYDPLSFEYRLNKTKTNLR